MDSNKPDFSHLIICSVCGALLEEDDEWCYECGVFNDFYKEQIVNFEI